MRFADVVDLEWQMLQDETSLREGKGPGVVERDLVLGARLLEESAVDVVTARSRLVTEPEFRREIAVGWIRKMRDGPGGLPGSGIESSYRLVGLVLGIAGALLGIGTAKAVLHYDGREPVNVFHFISVFFVLQILLLLVMVVAMSVRFAFGDVEVLGWMQRLILRLSETRWVALLLGRARAAAGEALGPMRGRAGLYAPVERWMLFALAQRFGLWFNVAALATCLALVFFTDLAFSWSTTLDMGAGEAHAWFRGLSFPFGFLSDRFVPSLALVEQSRWSMLMGKYEHGDPVDVMASAKFARQWWTFLVAGLVTYGLLPRLIAFLAGNWKYQRALLETPFDHAGFQRLYDRLFPPSLSVLAPSPAEVGLPEVVNARRLGRAAVVKPQGILPAAEPAAPPRKDSKPDRGSSLAVIAWGRFSPDAKALGAVLAARGGLGKVSVHQAGGDDLAADHATIAALRRDHPARVVLAVEPGVQPTKEIVGYLADLREALGARLPISVVIAGRTGRGGLEAADPQEIEAWRRRLGQTADPYLAVEGFPGPA